MILLLVLFLHLVHDDGQWGNADPGIRDWYQSLMQPDVPNASCCGEADAYWCDTIHTRSSTIDGKMHTSCICHRRSTGCPAG